MSNFGLNKDSEDKLYGLNMFPRIYKSYASLLIIYLRMRPFEVFNEMFGENLNEAKPKMNIDFLPDAWSIVKGKIKN